MKGDSLGRKLREVLTAASGALLAAVVALLTLMAGLFGTLYTGQIQSEFPFSRLRLPVPWQAAVFWATALVSAFLFFLGQFVAGQRRDHATRDLYGKADELANLIRTVPPPDFLYVFGSIYSDRFAVLSEVLPAASPKEAIQKAIRIVCAGIGTLAQKFDRQPPNTLYAVNIMRFRAVGGLTEAEAAGVQRRLKFCDPATDLRQLEGILDLDCELSTSTRVAPDKPDPTLVPMALPVPRIWRTADSLRWRVLPARLLPSSVTRSTGIAIPTPSASGVRIKAIFLETSSRSWKRISPRVRPRFEVSSRFRSLGLKIAS
ncbi:MAG TPA: hypothetical protein VMV27_10960 [Candidatus Binataceae bacterium]|nr:hypothetical protein [Candidatus Binataceae bacterium]